MTDLKLKTIPDVEITNHGTIFLFHAKTAAAHAWLREHVAGDAQWFGEALAVEHRYAEDLAAGMIEAGLELQ